MRIAALGETARCSSLYQSEPVGPSDQPDYINAVAELHSTRTPPAMLKALQAVEQQYGRVRVRHWGERSLDLDIILAFDEGRLLTSNTPILTLPHSHWLQRDFVLVPLLELAPKLEVDDLVLAELPLVKQSRLKPLVY